jgi:hypothetical protein
MGFGNSKLIKKDRGWSRALNKGLSMIAGSSSAGSMVGAPANSPTVVSVGALDQALTPSSFSPVGKIDLAAPGRDIFSAWTDRSATRRLAELQAPALM